jgi:head-tail adaptor
MLLTSYKVTPAVYRLRAGSTVDSYGDPVESWTAPQRTLLKGATVQDVNTEEVEGATRTLVRGEKALYAPGAIDLTEDDRIEVDGVVWRVNGLPNVRRGLASSVYTTATLTRVSS